MTQASSTAARAGASMFSRLILAGVALMGGMASAHAGADGIAEAGVGLAMPVASSGYRAEYNTSPTFWLAGVYLPRYGARSFGIELDAEYSPYSDNVSPPTAGAADFQRFRLQMGARYFRPIVPNLIGFARAVAGVELFSWTQEGTLGGVWFNDSGEHIGLALEAGAGVMYKLGRFSLGAQVALPVGVHRQVKHDGTIEINQTSFDVELRLTIGSTYD